MLFPVGTDAPIYHRPLATIALIGANLAMFAYADCWYGRPTMGTLALGDGLHPLQWLTCNFIHFGPVHLFGNMLFLMAFGLVAEGKLGWWRFILYYLVIGCVGCLLLQLCFLGASYPTRVAGASLAIYGLLATVLIWAPENEVEYLWVCRGYLGTSYDTNSTPYLYFCGYFVAKEILWVCCTGFTMSSQLGHTVGAVVGGALAVLLLRRKLVDCEDWDLFSVLAKRNTTSYLDRHQRRDPSPAESNVFTRLRGIRRDLQAAIARNNWQQAANLLLQMSPDERQECVGPEVIESAGNYVYQQKQFSDAAQLYQGLMRTQPAEFVRAKLKLAAVYAEVESRPQAARRVLDSIDRASLSPVLEKHWEQIAHRCTALIESGVVELSCRA